MSTENQLQLFEGHQVQREVDPHKSRHPFETGNAGTSLVIARLNYWGFPTVLSSEGCAYDLICDVNGSFLTLQVKTTCVLGEKMTFETRRSSALTGGPRKFSYIEGDYDISAVVSLPDQRVLFFAGITNRIYCKRQQFLRDGSELASWKTSLSKVQCGGAVTWQ